MVGLAGFVALIAGVAIVGYAPGLTALTAGHCANGCRCGAIGAALS